MPLTGTVPDAVSELKTRRRKSRAVVEALGVLPDYEEAFMAVLSNHFE
jgi:hypothetical protein